MTITENSILELIAGGPAGGNSGRGGATGLQVGIGDDGAVWRPRVGYETILTCDWFLEGTHFLRELHPPDSVGWKCLARAVSDVAAMGGTPKCFLLSLALPASHTGKWLNEFLGGLRRAATRLGCVLAGGDTSKRKDILINVTVIGEVRAGRSIVRSGARRGDFIYVSGHLGQAELGWRMLRGSKRLARPSDLVLQRHLYPVPRLALGLWLAENRLATAMMDLSDGVSPHVGASRGPRHPRAGSGCERDCQSRRRGHVLQPGFHNPIVHTLRCEMQPRKHESTKEVERGSFFVSSWQISALQTSRTGQQ
jgi:thiamine-monophosphate kinase